MSDTSIHLCTFNLGLMVRVEVLFIYFTGCVGKETARDRFGLRVKLPPVTTNLTTQR